MKDVKTTLSETEQIRNIACSGIEFCRDYVKSTSSKVLIKALCGVRTAGQRNLIQRELFSRLEPGDEVIAGCHRTRTIVEEITAGGKFVRLRDLYGRWGSKDVYILAHKLKDIKE